MRTQIVVSLLVICTTILIHARETQVATPGTPVLAQPSQGDTNVPVVVQLVWAPVCSADTNRYQIATDSVFNTIKIDGRIMGCASYPVVGPLANSTVYYWRVNSINHKDTAGSISPWSAIWHFRTAAATSISPLQKPLKLLEISNGALQFSLTQKSPVKIQIIDSKGAAVKTLVNETRGEGAYVVPVPKEFLDGFYLLDFTAGKYHKVMPIQGK